MTASQAQLEKLRLTDEIQLQLEENFSKLVSACNGDENAIDTVRNARRQARLNAANAGLEILQGNESGLKDLLTSLKSIQDELKNDLKHLENIVGVLDKITSAIRLGVRLVNFI